MPIESDNISQRIFDAFPPFPQITTMHALELVFPHLDRRSIHEALARLKKAGCIERGPAVGIWRRVKGATPPIDRRGHGKGGRKPKAKT